MFNRAHVFAAFASWWFDLTLLALKYFPPIDRLYLLVGVRVTEVPDPMLYVYTVYPLFINNL